MRIAFMHVPKTAGTTLHEFLCRGFGEERICPERFNDFSRFSRDDLRSYDLFSGHMTYATLKTIPGPLYTITVLRKPTDRIVSLYYFWRSFTDEHIERHDLHGPRLARRLSFLDFLRYRDEGIPDNIDNVYARTLATYPERDGGKTAVPTDRELVETAMENLGTFDLVGFSDELPALVAKIGALLEMDVPDPLPRLRSADDAGKDPITEKVTREPMTADIEAELERLTRADRAIYERAKTLFS